jgi:hypothetical protein
MTQLGFWAGCNWLVRQDVCVMQGCLHMHLTVTATAAAPGMHMYARETKENADAWAATCKQVDVGALPQLVLALTTGLERSSGNLAATTHGYGLHNALRSTHTPPTQRLALHLHLQ